MRARIAVLASGGGSNLQAIFEHFEQLGDRRSGEVVLAVSDRPAGALDHARQRGVPATTIATPRTPDAPDLFVLLQEHRVDYIALAGYLRLVPPEVVRQFEGRIVNVHPALLPAFGGTGMYGRRVHQAVLDSGATVSGVTVHFADEVYDRGGIIAQWPVPVLSGDDAASLAARVLRVEHILYPRVLDALAAERITVSSRPKVHRAGTTLFQMTSDSDACISEQIDRLFQEGQTLDAG
jgi:formyltetrahydrofolate-dependent phosphoribosylglycinamide formyltransferase